ncbi:hypothetical protein A605_05175 [Corynebacterium halotolerans YIM 70093 = DSM 44683]|uniref:Metallo-beta-lactamase domain-containing protein n=2 Tax=Corynebacterium halotolerans TaxID=225326 RepID=M1P5Y3_9CORY|nr:hypothetical protein A605_05175 [Corynebacterium halotolerans YIM 70093 = DSM 44683]
MGGMKITRHIHACVRIEHEGTRVLVDPGSFGVPDDLAAVDAVLVTHVHPDHVDPEALGAARHDNPDLRIFAPASVAAHLADDVTVVTHGDTFRVGALDVRVVGADHAVVTRATPVAENTGYLFNGQVLHAGDAFHPIRDVDCVLLPVNGPWVKMLDIEEFLSQYPPKRFIAIHDGIVNDHGLAINRKQLSKLAGEHGSEYLPLAPGESVEIG